MNKVSELAQRVTAALEFDRRVNLHRFPVRVTSEAGLLVLAGEVQDVAAKRISVRIARDLAGTESEVVDALDVVPSRLQGDGEMLDALTRSLLELSELKPCGLSRHHRGQIEIIRVPAQRSGSGQIELAIRNGVVDLAGSVASLSHRRVTEALAWWVPGCRNVIDRLVVEPPEDDNDGELADAVRLVLEIDPSLPGAEQLGIAVTMGVVTLSGAVRENGQRLRAETDTWCVDGVREVLNEIQVRP